MKRLAAMCSGSSSSITERGPSSGRSSGLASAAPARTSSGVIVSTLPTSSGSLRNTHGFPRRMCIVNVSPYLRLAPASSGSGRVAHPTACNALGIDGPGGSGRCMDSPECPFALAPLVGVFTALTARPSSGQGSSSVCCFSRQP
jgi:hypothetical protein